jgi:hypothetical protein
LNIDSAPSFRLAVLLLTLNLVSAAVFITLFNRPVYDDGFNLFDVHNYAAKGVTVETLRSQRNAPGPTSFVWMAAAVRLIGGNELRDSRIGALLSWLFLDTAVLLGARFSRNPELWYGALLVPLVFPHAVMATATVLTEGPALFFAVIGALAWTEFVSRANSGAITLLYGLLGGLFLGLSVTCRQYNLALLAAAVITVIQPLGTKVWAEGEKRPFVVRALLCLALSLLPILSLVLVWKGIASPSMESGASYNMMYKASAGLNFTRPIIASLRIAVYLVPFTFPLVKRIKPMYRWLTFAIAVAGGLAAGYWTESLLQPGPLNTIVGVAGRLVHSRALPFGLIAAAAIYNAIALGLTIWEERKLVWSSPLVAFSLLAILLFVGEQFGVGGNIPFYDRYVLQIAPFLGVIAFAFQAALDRARLFALITLSFFSHFMLWRYI